MWIRDGPSATAIPIWACLRWVASETRSGRVGVIGFHAHFAFDVLNLLFYLFDAALNRSPEADRAFDQRALHLGVGKNIGQARTENEPLDVAGVREREPALRPGTGIGSFSGLLLLGGRLVIVVIGVLSVIRAHGDLLFFTAFGRRGVFFYRFGSAQAFVCVLASASCRQHGRHSYRS